jgi:hypothetical protein
MLFPLQAALPNEWHRATSVVEWNFVGASVNYFFGFVDRKETSGCAVIQA